jgi:hypothetical protein
MNNKTLIKLNLLYENSRPVILHNGGYIEGPVPDELWKKMKEIEISCSDEATRQEIINAATKKRIASNCYTTWAERDRAGSKASGIYWTDTLKRWKIAIPQIQALINTHNAKTLSEYETYRIACEQGIAVPPQ